MGWLFGNTTKREADIEWLHTDIHSHVIPGIDDGASSMEDSSIGRRNVQFRLS